MIYKKNILSDILIVIIFVFFTVKYRSFCEKILEKKELRVKFTEFYILGPGGMADDYPTEFIMGDSATVIVGVVNHEYKVVNYSFELLLDKTWEKNVTFMTDKAGTDLKLQFFMYKEGNYSAPYRDLYLWINVTEEAHGKISG